MSDFNFSVQRPGLDSGFVERGTLTATIDIPNLLITLSYKNNVSANHQNPHAQNHRPLPLTSFGVIFQTSATLSHAWRVFYTENDEENDYSLLALTYIPAPGPNEHVLSGTLQGIERDDPAQWVADPTGPQGPPKY